jgi:hypothetical protein
MRIYSFFSTFFSILRYLPATARATATEAAASEAAKATSA